MNKTNKVLLYVGMIAAITGIPSCYASQNLGAGDMFDQLSPEQQLDFVKKFPFEITLQILKHLPQETKNLVLEPAKQLLDESLQHNIIDQQKKELEELELLKKAISSNNKEEAVKIINVMREQDANLLQKVLNQAILDASKVESVTFLIDMGADVNAKDKDTGKTPLHFAAQKNSKEIGEILISKGADINAKDRDGRTPLHEAAYYKAGEEMAVLLISKGADVNARGNNGMTPLHYAAFSNSKEIGELLISKGADINAKDDAGWTPLHYAAFSNSKEIGELLISKGADINAKDNKGRTPLQLAEEYRSTGVLQFLRDHGAKE